MSTYISKENHKNVTKSNQKPDKKLKTNRENPPIPRLHWLSNRNLRFPKDFDEPPLIEKRT